MDLPKVIELRKQKEVVYQKITEDVIKIIEFMLYFDKSLILQYISFPYEKVINGKTESVFNICVSQASNKKNNESWHYLIIDNYMVFDKKNEDFNFLNYTKSEFIEKFEVEPKDEGIIYVPTDEIAGTAILFNEGEELEFIRNLFDYIKNNQNKAISFYIRQDLDYKVWYLNIIMNNFRYKSGTQLIPGTYVVINSNNYSRMEYNVKLKELEKYYEKER